MLTKAHFRIACGGIRTHLSSIIKTTLSFKISAIPKSGERADIENAPPPVSPGGGGTLSRK